jgi:hypothetical protein
MGDGRLRQIRQAVVPRIARFLDRHPLDEAVDLGQREPGDADVEVLVETREVPQL